MQPKTKQQALDRLKTATTQILSHPILPGGAAVPVIHAVVSKGPIHPAVVTFLIAMGIYLVGDEIDRKIDAYISKLEEAIE